MIDEFREYCSYFKKTLKKDTQTDKEMYKTHKS